MSSDTSGLRLDARPECVLLLIALQRIAERGGDLEPDRVEQRITNLKPGHAAMWAHWQPLSKLP